MRLSGLDNDQAFDFGKTSKIYAKYRDIYPKELFEKLYTLGVGAKGQDWLDIGTGTGVLPRGMYHYGANITGTDISENQITEAVALSQESGMDIDYVVCSSEHTCFPDNCFDVVTACQCFWYFDPELVVPEIKRLLRKNGLFVKIYMAWLDEDPVAARSQALVRELNPGWTSGSAAVADLEKHYFDSPAVDSFWVDLPFTRETWDGRMKACRGVLASMTDDVYRQFSVKHKALMDELDERFTVAHKIYITSYRI